MAAAMSLTATDTASPHLVFGQTFDRLFNEVLAGRVTPELQQALRDVGLDLSRPLLPAYPMEVLEKCMEVAAQRLYRGVPQEVALRALGELQVDAFTRTLVGRATLAAMRLFSVKMALDRLSRAWRNANNFVQTEVREINRDLYEVWVNEVGRFPEITLGIMSAILKHLGQGKFQVTIAHYDGHACTYRISVQPPPSP
ncbi:DUF2378 family protein [Hyalangium rubrum]|uniref:DUF2378 family protein n=1 Tax=Hyalangium rubrum TaxID=3103134 RepID=A0ABU5H4U3_9BACT|nr:DUF2378 family protein [Hyalangium sp. s54d21]MDY7228500.1 DUF2378 family protein [Hyalangium sp. s54d21]